MPLQPYFKEEHEQLRRTVQRFVEKEIAPYVEEWEAAGEFPQELFQRMGELGFLGLAYPEEVGGQGGDYFMNLIFAEELNKCGCGGVPLSVAVQTDMATPAIYQFGTKEQQEKFLKPALKGEKIGAIGITEPNHGSDVKSIEMKAQKDGNEWVLNGAKTFITNGTRCDFVTLIARTSEEPGSKGFSLFIVESDRPGFKVGKKLDKVGMLSSDTAELILEDVRIPEENLLGEEGNGFYHLMWQLQGERLIMAAGSIGQAEYAYQEALKYAQQRKQFNRPIVRFQVISHLFAEMATEIEVCRELVYAAAYQFQQGKVLPRDISMAKLAAAQMSYWVADRCLQVYGGNGYMMEYSVQRSWRDTRLSRIGAGTDEIMKEIIAKEIGL